MRAALICLWISNEALARMLEDADLHSPQETGGLLIGYRASPTEAVITEIVDGGPNAQRDRARFLPDHDHQVAKVERIYRESSETLVYLGDWHTHPRGSLCLSHTDRKTLRAIASAPEADLEEPIMLLLAGGPDWSVAAWYWRRRARLWNRLQPCKLIMY